MEIYYSGIGSRTAPKDVLVMMEKIGRILAQKGFILRSGAAEGCDTAIEKGCDSVNGKNGVLQGGTSQAIRVAEGEGNGKIKIFNLFFKDKLEDLKEYIKELEEEQQNT